MAAISGLDWDDDMTPWEAPPIAENEPPCGGKADEYLRLLCGEILPYVLGEIKAEPKYIAIAGYSLGGLFAVYSLYKSDIFSAAMSASGSFWYPGFLQFAKENRLNEKADCIYISLGDREKFTKNEYLGTVQDNTEELFKHYRELGLKTTFELNKGNHFQKSDLRTAKGIKWLLENK